MTKHPLRVTESMTDQNMVCHRCSRSMVKNGKSKNGQQRYYCKNCNSYCQQQYAYLACQKDMDDKIISLTNESCGIRSISRLLKISASTVIRRIKLIAAKIKRPFAINMGKEYEVDEMRTYIGNKARKYWVTYALRKDTREVTDFKVGKRTTNTLQRVVDTLLLSDAKTIFTDGYRLYKSLIPEELHRIRA